MYELEVNQMDFLKIDYLGNTLAGNKCYSIDITANGTDEEIR